MTDQPPLHWYPVTADCPPSVVHVRGIVQCTGIEAHLIVSRGKPPHTRSWVQWIRGKAVPVSVPIAWQPQWPETWRMPLPEPLPTPASGVMFAERMAFAAVEAAENAERAREMERDREDARRGRSETGGREPLAWWRDASQIRYEPKGSITPRMAEGRIMRAVALCGHGQGLKIKSRTFGMVLADIAARADQPYATSDYVPHLKALPTDHDDFDIAMGWFVRLKAPTVTAYHLARADWDGFNRWQEILIFRSFNIPLSFGEISERWDVSDRRAKDIYSETIHRVARIANGVGRYAADHEIDALRERNRELRKT